MPVLYPCQDKNVILVSRHRDRLTPWYHIMLPPHDVVETLMNKAAFADTRQHASLPIPPTFVLQNREDAETSGEHPAYPAVIKPAERLRAVVEAHETQGVRGGNPVSSWPTTTESTRGRMG